MTKLIPRLIITLLTLLILSPAARAEGRMVREFTVDDLTMSFKRIAYRNTAAAGLLCEKDDQFAFIEVNESPKESPRTINILQVDNPGITQTRYFLLGDIKYENVDGDAYLEMWNDFPDGGHYFSRTLGDRGPMMKITGTSASRPFMLPFTSDAGQVPSKLTLNVVMPGNGKVTLSRIRLVENGEPATTPTLEQRMRQRREQARSQDGTATSGPSTLRNDLNTLDDGAPAAATPAGVATLFVPQQVEMNGEGGVRAFAFDRPDPTGIRQVFVRVYQSPFGGFPERLRGRLTWRGVDGEPAKLVYWTEDARRTPRPPATIALTHDADGSADIDVPVADRSAEWLVVSLVCPGTGRFEFDLPPTLAPLPTAIAALAWTGRHSAYLFAGLVAATLLTLVPLRLLMKTGRGRSVVLGFFGLMFAGGVAQLFAAGVVLGMGRPADAWVTLLGCAAILLVCGGLMLRQARAHYAGVELRKLRAMDVA